MGWGSAGDIFDPVAEVVTGSQCLSSTKTAILTALIKRLQAGDWDTEDESLERWRMNASVVAAFAACDVHLPDARFREAIDCLSLAGVAEGEARAMLNEVIAEDRRRRGEDG